MIDSSLRVLRTDVAGMPIDWIGYQEAARLYALDHAPISYGWKTVHNLWWHKCKKWKAEYA